MASLVMIASFTLVSCEKTTPEQSFIESITGDWSIESNHNADGTEFPFDPEGEDIGLRISATECIIGDCAVNTTKFYPYAKAYGENMRIENNTLHLTIVENTYTLAFTCTLVDNMLKVVNDDDKSYYMLKKTTFTEIFE